jgi:hypothetical protein
MFDGYDEFVIAEFLSKYKGIVVNEGFDFMLIACSQVD